MAKSLCNILKKMGFRVHDDKKKEVAHIVKVVIYRLVRNIMNNVMPVAASANTSMINADVIATTSRVCKRCVRKFNKASSSAQKGGDPSLPSEYFSGVLTAHYTPSNGDTYQSVAPTDGVTRHGMDLRMSGGKPSDYTDHSYLIALIERKMIPKFMKESEFEEFTITKCALDRIAKAVHENMLIIFDYVYADHCGGFSSKQCELDVHTLKKVLRSPAFSFLH
jgi:hypothetical protein